MFSLNVMGHQNGDSYLEIMKDDTFLVTAYSARGDQSLGGSAFVITECDVDQVVWIRARTDCWILGSDIYSYTQFSGYLLNVY